MKVTIEISEDQVERLEKLQQERNATREQVVRETIAAYLPPSRSGHLLDYFGALRGRVEDGMVFQDRMRREWDRDE